MDEEEVGWDLLVRYNYSDLYDLTLTHSCSFDHSNNRAVNTRMLRNIEGLQTENQFTIVLIRRKQFKHECIIILLL